MPTTHAMASATFLLEVGVMFCVIGLCGVAAKRIGLSVSPFYIVAGMLSSPYVVGRLGVPYTQETVFIEIAAELGIVFLVFFLGFECNLDRLIENWRLIGNPGLIDPVINVTVGFAIGYAFFGNLIAAALMAAISYISSSAIITKPLIDLGWIAHNESNPMLGTVLMQYSGLVERLIPDWTAPVESSGFREAE